MYRVAICEDEAADREDLTRRFGNILTSFDMPHTITSFASAEELEAVLTTQGEPFDLLLLDILLPGKNGVALGASLRSLNDQVGIIFITVCADFALEGYKAQPCNYLMKPVSDQALANALRTELRRHNKHQAVVFQERGEIVRLPALDILYIESLNHGIRVHTIKETLPFFLPLSRAKELLPPGMFARCHNSFLVNLSHIKSASSTKVIFQSGLELPVGRTYRNEFHRVFIDHFF